MTKSQPTIDDILNEFFGQQAATRKGRAQQRVRAVERLLRECLETEGYRVLVDRDLVILAAEREFHPSDAFVRSMRADDLIFALPVYLSATWLQAELLLRQQQLILTDKLCGFIIGRRLIDQGDLCCPLIDIRCAIDRGKRALNEERRMARLSE